MPQYTLPQCPELLLAVPNSDPEKARYRATQKLVQLINENQLDVQIPEGFSTRRLIEITEKDLMAQGEDKVIEAVKTLSKLSASRRKVLELHEQALEARHQIDVLFEEKRITAEEFEKIEEGFRVLREFATANLRYKEALPNAEAARLIIDQALESPKFT